MQVSEMYSRGKMMVGVQDAPLHDATEIVSFPPAVFEVEGQLPAEEAERGSEEQDFILKMAEFADLGRRISARRREMSTRPARARTPMHRAAWLA